MYIFVKVGRKKYLMQLVKTVVVYKKVDNELIKIMLLIKKQTVCKQALILTDLDTKFPDFTDLVLPKGQNQCYFVLKPIFAKFCIPNSWQRKVLKASHYN